MKRVLVVTAHPGDLENCIGGTLTHLIRAGYSVVSLVATLPKDANQKLLRRSESNNAHALLGARPFFWDEHDGALEANAYLRKMMQLVYDNLEPDIVLAPWSADMHPDHRAVADLALGPALRQGVNIELLCFEACSSVRGSTEFQPQSLGFRPTHYVDTTYVQEEKYHLTQCHQSQDADGMWLATRNMHGRRSIEAGGLGYMEGFVRLTRCGVMAPELSAIFQQSPISLPRGIGVHFKPETIGIQL